MYDIYIDEDIERYLFSLLNKNQTKAKYEYTCQICYLIKACPNFLGSWRLEIVNII